MKDKKKKKENKYDPDIIIDQDEYLNETNNVASAAECTGIAPTKVKSKNEAESYTDIYDIPINSTKKQKKKSKSE